MFNFLNKKKSYKKILVSYAKGNFIPITDVPDPIFSEKMMGDGVAILVDGDTIYAPCDAKVAMVATTYHAVGLNLADGTELLIHIGLETVNLNGKGFTPLVKANDEIKKGQPIMKIDLNVMKENNLELYTPLVILNQDSHPFKDIHKQDDIEVGDELIQFNRVEG